MTLERTACCTSYFELFTSYYYGHGIMKDGGVCMREMRNAYKILVGKSDGLKPSEALGLR
jgi:hypothetical protein